MKSDIFPWDILKYGKTFYLSQNMKKYKITFIIGIFQVHCKSKHKQVKSNQIKRNLCKSDIMFH